MAIASFFLTRGPCSSVMQTRVPRLSDTRRVVNRCERSFLQGFSPCSRPCQRFAKPVGFADSPISCVRHLSRFFWGKTPPLWRCSVTRLACHPYGVRGCSTPRVWSAISQRRVTGSSTRRNRCRSQTPPDLVVKFQPVDIVDVILWLVLRQRVVYQREIKG